MNNILGGGGMQWTRPPGGHRTSRGWRAGWLLCLVLALAAAMAVAAPAGNSAGAGATRLPGLPLMRLFTSAELPGAPSYSSVAVDAEGTLFVGSHDGLMIYRSGTWELVTLPRRAAVYSLLATSDDRLFVAGVGLFGQLQRLADGSFHFEDLAGRMDGMLSGNLGRTFYGLAEAADGVYFRNYDSLFRLGRDGSVLHVPFPKGTSYQLFPAGGAIYTPFAGRGLCRLVDGQPQLLPGGEALDRAGVAGIWEREDGLLVVSARGLHLADAQGVRALPSPVVPLLARNRPYSGTRLHDGSLVLSLEDGSLLRLSADLSQVEAIPLGKDVAYGFASDPEGGLWVVGDGGLARLRLPSPWSLFDRRHGLEWRLFDFAWFDGALWAASSGLLRSQAPADGGMARFEPVPWADGYGEVLSLLATPGGLLVGDRRGVSLVEQGTQVPRRLFPDNPPGSIVVLQASPFVPGRVLAAGGRNAMWLQYRDGQWQVLARWRPEVGGFNGVFQVAPGEVWVGDSLGGVQRWRFDPDSGQLLEQAHLDQEVGLATDSDLGTRLLMLDGQLYAISGTRVQRLQDGRFVEAELPELPGLERPWELDMAQTPVATFAWTSQQLWWRAAGQPRFTLRHTGLGRVPGYAKAELQADGQLRLLAREHILQFDPALDSGSRWRLRSRIDRLQLRLADGTVEALPRQPQGVLRVPPGAGAAIRFGLATMEDDFEFRFRIPGYHARWSDWSSDRDIQFQRLPPGRYTLEYQGRIRGGTVADPGSLQLQVTPFWYEQWWVRLLFGLAGLGVLALLVWLRNRSINQRNRELERKIAERTAELELANRRLTELAVVDGLTGVPNRRALERALERGWQRCAAHQEPLVVVMADVDHFKRYNDTHGHQAGDECLRQVALTLAGAAHGVDEIAARYGGEEFVLVLPGIGLDEALARAEALRAEVERSLGASAGCTISLGVAVAHPPSGSPAQLLGAADRALYRAKHEGRNCVRTAPGPGVEVAGA